MTSNTEKPVPGELAVSVALNSRERVEELLRYGADVNDADKTGSSALMLAARAGNVQMAQLLIDHGADIEKGSAHGVTPLMGAVHTGHTDVARLLIKRGAAVNASNKYGWTVLMHAVGVMGQVALIRLLLEAGADTGMRNNRNMTAEDIAKGIRRADIAQLLKEYEGHHYSMAAKRQHRLKALSRKPVMIRRPQP